MQKTLCTHAKPNLHAWNLIHVNEKYYIQKNNSSTQNNVFIKCFSNTKRFTVLSWIAFLTCFQTCYLFLGPLPDPAVLAVGEALKGLTPQPLISSVLNDFSELSLVDSRFGPVPRGSVLSYQCPPTSALLSWPKTRWNTLMLLCSQNSLLMVLHFQGVCTSSQAATSSSIWRA